MGRFWTLGLLAIGAAVGIAGVHVYASYSSEVLRLASSWNRSAPAAEGTILYYRDPSGAPYWSAAPKKDERGRDYLPVYKDQDASFDGEAASAPGDKKDSGRKILYYRNPMGLPDTSPVPKKDSMGMDYIPVYADEVDEGGTVRVSLDKVQRSGVRTEKVDTQKLSRSVRGIGIVNHDESLLTIVTVRSDGYIEELFVDKTGQHVKAGEPLFRFYSSQIQLAQVDLLVAIRARGRSDAGREVEGARQKLRNLDVPEARIEEVIETTTNPRTLDWPSPATGDVVAKNVIEGQRVVAGEELFRIADHSKVWVIAEVAEADIADIAVGTPVTVTLRAYVNAPHEGVVTFIYPEMMKPEMRTISVRIELPNPDGRMKPGMYADAVFHPGAETTPVAAVPASAVIDSGARKIVLITKGEGRFEPREVKLGRRGEGYFEVLEGVSPGEEVVTSATFLIDSESNLKAALQAFNRHEAQR
ncbi:MAG: efflux RND transporter periplasmic adaptor subunit [Methyloceanibacter sp.]